MGGSTLLDGARMIHNENVPLFVGCTKTNLCTEVQRMVKSVRNFTEAPRPGALRAMGQEELDREAKDAGVKAFELTQLLPGGLDYIADSASAGAQVETDGDQTRLRWAWSLPDATAAQTVTFRVLPNQEGVWTVGGDMSITDNGDTERTLPLPGRVITVSGLCLPVETPTLPPPTATDTPTPIPPTDTPLPPTATATPEPSATPRPAPAYLPVTLAMRCLPDEHLGDIVLVIDVSTSMDRVTEDGVAKKEAVLTAARLFIDRLDFTPNERDQHDQVAVVGFNQAAWVAQPLTGDRQAVLSALVGLDARQASGTRLDLAFLRAAEAFDPGLCKAGNKPVIILLTDGVPTQVPAHPETGRVEDTVLAAAAEAKGRGITVYTIGFGRGDAPDPADQVNPELLAGCASSPDKAYIEPRADRLSEIYAEIAEVLGCPKRWW